MTTDLKAMYKKVHKDAFPETMTILLGDEKLVYHKRVWTLDNEEKGLRYGMNCVKVASPAAACAGVAPVRASCRP
jgi:phosphoribosylaminoimidazolecarboxamide formyltransferase/IMP cyclohydrolase